VAGAEIPGLRPPKLLWRLGPFSDSKPADRVAAPRPAYNTPPQGVDLMADLKADQTVDFALQAEDELHNPVPLPADATAVFSVDRPDVLTLTDNGDGTGSVTAVGLLDTSILHVDATVNGRAVTGDVSITVIAGDAERVSIALGTPTEATPDA
jgi:hypothetical protein